MRTHEQLARSTGQALDRPAHVDAVARPDHAAPARRRNMGATAADGVVESRGEVFGYQNLYVADGAIVPEAIGLNPSKPLPRWPNASRR